MGEYIRTEGPPDRRIYPSSMLIHCNQHTRLKQMTKIFVSDPELKDEKRK